MPYQSRDAFTVKGEGVQGRAKVLGWSRSVLWLSLTGIMLSPGAFGQAIRAAPQEGTVSAASTSHRLGQDRRGNTDYILGPDDEFTVDALDAPEFNNLIFRVDNGGCTGMPLLGRVRVAGLTSAQLERELAGRLKEYIRNPSVVISIKDFRSQPVSVLGSVNTPGSYQIRGGKLLTEVLAMAGGLRSDAGPRVRITRKLSAGRIPLSSAADDTTGQYTVAEISVKKLFSGEAPAEDIPVLPYDSILVPRGELVYVVGDVQKSGGFLLGENETLSALQALSLAGGLMPTAAPKNTRLLRVEAGQSSRTEIQLDLKSILAGKSVDVGLKSEDILFIPSNTAKKAAVRAIEAIIQTGTGIAIWRAGGRY